LYCTGLDCIELDWIELRRDLSDGLEWSRVYHDILFYYDLVVMHCGCGGFCCGLCCSRCTLSCVVVYLTCCIVWVFVFCSMFCIVTFIVSSFYLYCISLLFDFVYRILLFRSFVVFVLLHCVFRYRILFPSILRSVMRSFGRVCRAFMVSVLSIRHARLSFFSLFFFGSCFFLSFSFCLSFPFGELLRDGFSGLL